VEWKDVGILLEVKPQVTNDNRIFMEIKIEKSSKGEDVQTTEGTMFSVKTKRAETKVLIADGETTVVGGLFEQTESGTDNTVPGSPTSDLRLALQEQDEEHGQERADDLPDAAAGRDLAGCCPAGGRWECTPAGGCISFSGGRMVWRHYTAGESHGPALLAFLEGCRRACCSAPPTSTRSWRGGSSATAAARGWRSRRTAAEFVGGVRFGKTTGAPLALLIRNRGTEQLSDRPADYRPLLFPRPGHADLAAAIKYDLDDIRDVLERASARETAARVALGACAKQLLAEFDIRVHSFVEGIGAVRGSFRSASPTRRAAARSARRSAARRQALGRDGPRDRPGRGRRRLPRRRRARRRRGRAPGPRQPHAVDLRIEGRIGAALLALPGVKGVESGLGFEAARHPGSRVHDAIYRDPDKPWGWHRRTNRAGASRGGSRTARP